MSDQLRVNGNMYSWGSIKVKLGGEAYTGFTSITYGDKRERAKGYGMGRHYSPVGRTRGKYTPDPVKLKGRKGSVRDLIAALAMQSSDGRSFGNVEFEISVQFVEPGSSEIPINDTLEQCVVTAINAPNDEGTDPLSEELEIDCMRIRRDTYALWDDTGESQ